LTSSVFFGRLDFRQNAGFSITGPKDFCHG
jgi:hypothetical protein